MSQKAFKNVGIGILSIPIGFLLLFTFGEVFAGDISGLSHLILATPLIILLLLSIKKPYVGGLILSANGIIFGVLYILKAPFEIFTILLVELFLFVPPFIAGLLLIKSSKKK